MTKTILSYQIVLLQELTSLVMAKKIPEDETNQRGKEGLRERKKEGKEEGNLSIRGAVVSFISTLAE